MRNLAILSLTVLLICSCKSSKDLSKVEESKTKFVMPELKSTLNLNYKLSKQTSQDTFNRIIDAYLSNGMAMDAMGMEIVVKKQELAEIEISGRKVLTKLPIEIGITKSTIINNIKASGILDLSFITSIDIDSSWNLVTGTSLEYYEWLEEPKLSLGGFSIPLGKLANNIIDKSKAQLESQIDQSINDQLAIKDKVLEMLKYVENPIQIDTIMNSWVSISPQKIYMSEIVNEEEYFIGNITVHGESIITEEKPVIIPELGLPEFSWQESLDEVSHINIIINLSYEKINQYLNENYKGKTFSSDNKSITLNDIEVSNKKDKLVVSSNVSGSVNGQLLITGSPIFDNDKQAFYVDDIDINIKTKNVVHRAAAWLFKSKIKNQLKELLSFSIQDNIGSIQEQIDSQIEQYSIDQDLILNADIKKINVDRFVLSSEKIHSFITLNVLFGAEINDMNIFNHNNSHRLRLKN